MSRIRVAIVGCGRISRNHIKAISSHHSKAEIVAICDTSRDSLNEADMLIKASYAELNLSPSTLLSYLSYQSLLNDVRSGVLKLDLVTICTPSGVHSSQAICAAQAGLHVCTEKPMATRWTDGIAMVKACDDAGVKLFVVKQNRFNSTLQLVRRQLMAGRFGRLAMVSINVFWHRPQSYYDQAAWRGTWEFDGGALMNQASHYFDLLDWLIGPVESVSASTATISRSIEVEDTAAIQLKWRNGALGTMAVTMLTYPKNLEGSITILGDSGTVRIGGTAVNEIQHWEFDSESPDDDLVTSASYQPLSVYGFGHSPYYENVFDHLQGKSAAVCDGREGLRSLELIIAIYRSARDSKTVNLPLDL